MAETRLWAMRAAIASVGALLLTALHLGGAYLPVSAGFTSPPSYAHSYYVTNTDGPTMYNLGKADALRDVQECSASNPVDDMVVLDFGQMTARGSSYNGYGTYIFTTPAQYHPLDDAGGAINNYNQGWYQYSGYCPRLHVIIGTNSYYECAGATQTCSAYGFGQALGTLGYLTQGFVNSMGASWQETVWVGDDIEGSYDCPGRALQIPQGLVSNNPGGVELMDFGDAGFDQNCIEHGPPYNEANWTGQTIYQAAFAWADWPLAECYYQSQVDHWAAVDKNIGSMYFRGVMSTTVGNSPNNAWYALWNTLIANGIPQSELNYSTRIAFQ